MAFPNRYCIVTKCKIWGILVSRKGSLLTSGVTNEGSKGINVSHELKLTEVGKIMELLKLFLTPLCISTFVLQLWGYVGCMDAFQVP